EDDLDLRGRDIREGVNRQAVEGIDAGAGQHAGQHQHEQALPEREADQGGQHYSRPTPVSMALRPDTPLTAMTSFAATPSTSTVSPLWLITRTRRASNCTCWSLAVVCTKT